MTIREEIDAQFPIRKTTAQKRAFEKWVMAKMREMGYRPYVDLSLIHISEPTRRS